jgi:subtilisin family serine protease
VTASRPIRPLRRLLVTALGAVLTCTFALAASPAGAAGPGPLGRYIVVLRAGTGSPAAVAADQVGRLGGSLGFVYEHALRGYSAALPVSAVAGLAADPRVALVEADGVMHADVTQTGATWGLDRIDQTGRPLNGTYTYAGTGSGVKAYIIDTGIHFAHADFGGRAIRGTDKVSAGLLGGGLLGGGGSTNGEDCNGHGTHVSGTVGGSTYGVAKQVTLVAVRVLDCGGSGSTSGVIAGVDWVTADHAAGQPAVANMSLGGGASAALDQAVQSSIADGVAYGIAAGNGNQLGMAEDACNTSPARVAAAMTIGASDSSDVKASWSNYGNCVDWFAPGVSITSDWYSSDTATNTISGTSMATPHTVGVAALYFAAHPSFTAAQVRDGLYTLTTKGIVTSSSTANNHLLFTNL